MKTPTVAAGHPHHSIPLSPALERWLKWLAAPALGFLLVFFLPSSAGGQSVGDYGDAPDGSDSYYPVPSGQPPIMGNFPTLFNTSNSRVGAPGVHHLVVGEEWFGPPGAVPSAELDATDPADPDGIANLVGNDKFDDGLPPVPFFIVLTSLPPQCTITFRVSVAAGAPDIDRYVNIVIDWDRSGDWKLNPAGVAEEWVIKNLVVRVPPGTSKWITTPPFAWGQGAVLAPQIFWLRMNLSREVLDPSPAGPWGVVGGWDGSGVFTHGETEDYLFHPGRRHDDPGPFPPPPLPLPGTGGYYSFLPGIRLVPQSQDVAHGTPAKITVELIDSATKMPIGAPPPDYLGWAVDAAFNGPPSIPPFGYNPLDPPPPGGVPPITWPAPGGSGSQATWTPGAAPNLGTITITSMVHPFTSPEEWAFRVRAKWIGIRAQTRKAIVHIWHMWPWGCESIFAQFSVLDSTIASLPLSPGDMGILTTFANAANTAWQSNDLAGMNGQLTWVEEMAAQFYDEEKITYAQYQQVKDLAEGIRESANLLGPVPVPVWAAPTEGDTVRGVTTLTATTLLPDVVGAAFTAIDASGTYAVYIGEDTDGGDGWSVPWDTTQMPDGTPLPDGIYKVTCTMENSGGLSDGNVIAVWVDNHVPAPTPLDAPPVAVGLVGLSVTAPDPEEDVASCAFALRPAGGPEWFALPTDYGGDDDGVWRSQVDTSQLPEGMYEVLATLSDEAGNTADALWLMQVLPPNYASWKTAYGVTDDNEDNDCDGLAAVFEYYLGTHPGVYNPPDSVVRYGRQGNVFFLRWQTGPMVNGLTAVLQYSTDLNLWDNMFTDPPGGPPEDFECDLPTEFEARQFLRFNFIRD